LEPATPGVTGRYSNRLNYRSLTPSVHCVFQCLAGFEARNSGSSDLDGLASLPVATFAGSTLLDSESAEAHQRYRITFLQCTGDRLNRCIQSTARISFGQIRCSGDG